jgi:hypothetical protein
LEKITFLNGGPVWVKLRKSVIFFKDTVFWGVNSCPWGLLWFWQKIAQNEEIIDEFKRNLKGFFSIISVFLMSENTTIWAKNPKVQPNTLLKAPTCRFFPKSDPAKSATDFLPTENRQPIFYA